MKFAKISIAVAALLSNTSAVHMQIKTAEGQTLSSLASVDANYEQNRFIGSNGQPIILAETEGHARLELTKVPKYTEEFRAQTLAQISNDRKPLSASESKAKPGCTKEQLEATANHCPVNQSGPAKVHIHQENLEDNAYISDIYVGNPPQKIRALFDTGSTNTWILNDRVQLPGNAVKEFSYKDEESCSAKILPQRAMIQFGSGALAGHFMTDDIRVGSCDAKSTGQIHIKDQKFGNVEKQSTIFTGKNFEAIVGMAYPALAEKGVTPVFDEMMGQKLLKQNIFAFYFTSKQAENLGMKSDLTLGYYDKAKFQGDVHWNDVKFKYMFGVKLDDVKFNGKSAGLCDNKECLITFDSGTSLMSMPTFATNKLAAANIPTASHGVACKNPTQFGEMTLVIGGKDYTLDNDEWMFPIDKSNLAQSQQKMMKKYAPLGPQLMTQVTDELPKIPENANTIMIDAEETGHSGSKC